MRLSVGVRSLGSWSSTPWYWPPCGFSGMLCVYTEDCWPGCGVIPGLVDSCCCCCDSERLFIVAVMPSKLGARVELAFMLAGPIRPMPSILPLILARPAPGSSLIICASEPFGSRILYCAIVRIFLVTQPARILPLCFSPSLDRWKSPFCTKDTISMTS